MSKRFIYTAYMLITFCLLSSSCFKRDLDVNIDNLNVKKEESLKDNEYLRFKTFRLKDYDNYIIFGNNNEVSLLGNATTPIHVDVDGHNTYAKFNLMGSIYEYDHKSESITFKEALFECSSFSKPKVVDVNFVFSLLPDKNNGLDMFKFKFKGFKFTDSDKDLFAGDNFNVDDHVVSITSESNFTLLHYKN